MTLGCQYRVLENGSHDSANIFYVATMGYWRSNRDSESQKDSNMEALEITHMLYSNDRGVDDIEVCIAFAGYFFFLVIFMLGKWIISTCIKNTKWKKNSMVSSRNILLWAEFTSCQLWIYLSIILSRNVEMGSWTT